MQSISGIVKQFKQDWTEELTPCRIAAACHDGGMTWISSMLNPVTTIQIFLLQILHGNTACTELPHLTRMTFTAAGYCKARMRLPLKVFELLLQRCVIGLQSHMLDSGRWFGHRVFFVDGSSFSMSDNPELQAAFGQPSGQKPGCGFPVAHWLALMHMGTGMVTAMLTSPMRTHDMKRAAELHPELRAGDLLVADRAFCSYPHLCLLIERGIEAVIRIHQATLVDFTPNRKHAVPGKRRTANRKGLPRSRWLRQLGVQDQIVEWLKNPRSKPDWMEQDQFDSLPEKIAVRELRYQVHEKGFRAKSITLVTTLLDHEVFSLPELAALFRRRWEIETNFGHVKTTMKMDVLKCKTVNGVLKELHAFALIYNLIRQVALSAAINQNVSTQKISFIDALRWLKWAKSGDELARLVVLPHRPNRIEPRVRKRRPKQYKLMTIPRCQLREALILQ